MLLQVDNNLYKNLNRSKKMNEQDRLNGEYLTGWEIVASIIIFALIFATCYLILLIGA